MSAAEPLQWLRLDPGLLCDDESVAALGFAELGLHASLLAPAWRNDGLPADPAQLLQVRARGAEQFRQLWPAIEHLWPLQPDGRRRNQWLEEQRVQSLALREQKRANRRGNGRATAVERPSDDSATADESGDANPTDPTNPTGQDRPNSTNQTVPATVERPCDARQNGAAGSGEEAEAVKGEGGGEGSGPDLNLHGAAGVLDVLLHTNIGDGSRGRVNTVKELAAMAFAQNIDAHDMAQLERAAAKGKNPSALLRSWIERGQCQEILASRCRKPSRENFAEKDYGEIRRIAR